MHMFMIFDMYQTMHYVHYFIKYLQGHKQIRVLVQCGYDISPGFIDTPPSPSPGPGARVGH